MPGGDGTGPAGMGPMTGRAAGYCAGYGMPGYMNPSFGRGFFGRGGGRGFGGRGGGRGRRNWFYATGIPGWQRAQYGYPAMPYEPAPEQELSMLKEQAQDIQNALEEINERIKEIESEKSGK